MKEINRTNYEAYFIDYLEGNLDEALINSFISFLKENPDLKKELELYEPILVEPENLAFNNKTELYKSRYDTEETFNNAAIALLENDMSEEEKQEFENYLASHPDKEKKAAAFRHTILKADENIVFEVKKTLYKKTLGKTILMWTSRVAAILFLGLVVFNFINRKNSVEENVAQQILKIEQTPQKTNEQLPKIEHKIAEATMVTETVEREIPSSVKQIRPKKPLIKNIAEEKNTTSAPNKLLATREKLIIPEMLHSISASINTEQPSALLATMHIEYPAENYHDEVLLADRMKEKLNLRKISKAGLDLIASISDDRFEYKTNTEGKVVNYTYESRLLAFSIPGKNEKRE